MMEEQIRYEKVVVDDSMGRGSGTDRVRFSKDGVETVTMEGANDIGVACESSKGEGHGEGEGAKL